VASEHDRAGVTDRIVYLSNAAIPSRASNAMQTMRMCGAFAAAGWDVELLHAAEPAERPEGLAEGDVWGFYGLEPAFARTELALPLARLAARSRRYSLAARAVRLGAAVAARSRPGAPEFVAYARSYLGARLALEARRLWRGAAACRAVALELHDEPRDRRSWDTIERADAVFAITDSLRAHVLEHLPEAAGRVWTEPDAVDLKFYVDGDKKQARQRLGIPVDEKLVVYTGRARADKGVDVLLEAAALLEDVARVIVVGKVYEPSFTQRAARLSNVTLTGFVPPAAVAGYQLAADVLVMPTTEDLHYARYTSPLKLFEYMATGNPIVASDLPVVQEVLRDGENALLYPSTDAPALAAAVTRALHDPASAERVAARAREEVARYTWSARAERITSRLRDLLGQSSP
jgi:glycosyltransferase involved in cell wall biosynthesis